MKNLIIPIVLIALVSACNPKKGETAAVVIDKEQIKQEIQAKEDEFAAVYNSGELKDIGYYAEDAVTFLQNKEPLVGRKAIVEFLTSDFASSKRVSFITNEVFVSTDGNQVVEAGSFKIVDSSTGATINSGNYISLFEKRDGKYVCLRDMSASDQPVE